MATKTLRTRRRFRNLWDEINYLYGKLLYWLYRREDRRHALRFAPRLQRLVDRVDPAQDAIKAAECRSLLAEVRGDLLQATAQREKEIRLIKRLWAISAGKPGKDHPLQDYGPEDLSDRLDLLAILYHDAGKIQKAVATLYASQQLCAQYAVPFDAQDLLRDYLAEQASAEQNGNKKARSA